MRGCTIHPSTIMMPSYMQPRPTPPHRWNAPPKTTGGVFYYTDPVLWDPVRSTCRLSEAIEGRVSEEERTIRQNI